ncbi:MAG: PAS domain S-box protein [Balneolaceae bacterium]|nr:PAS domain S-box protein [Balneolaceae bacterium]
MAILEQNIHVLIIEDNPGDYVLIQEYLLEEAENPTIEHVKTFADAQKHLTEDNSFDSILLDLTLPDTSGETLVENIIDLAGQTPVIVLTGYENEQFGLKTLGMGIADYLLKDELNPYLLAKSISYSIERNRINQNLKKSEQQYRNLFDLSPLPKWVYDAETLKFLDVNQRAISHYGYTRDEFLSMTIRDIRPKEGIPAMEKAMENSLQAEGFYDAGTHTHRKKNGDLIQVHIRSKLITYGGRKAKIIIANDITQKIEAERELRLSEQRFKSLVQEGADMIAVLDEEGDYKYISANYEQITGWKPGELIGKNAFDYIYPEDRKTIQKVFQELQDNKQAKTPPFRFKHKEKGWMWIESTGRKLSEDAAIDGFIINSHDVTESIKREQKLQESLELYEYVTKATDDIIYDWDIENDNLKWDDSFREKFVYNIEGGTYTIQDWIQNVHPEDLEDAEASLYSTLEDSSQSKLEQEYRVQKKDGSYATVFERGFIIRNSSGQAERMIGSLQDITERKEYEEKLEELALVAAKTTDIIIITDPDERITWVNNAFEKLTGYSFDEAKEKIPGDFLQGPETDPATRKRLAEKIDRKESLQEVILNYSKSGEKYWLDLTIDPIFDDEGNCEGFIAIEKDVTEQIEQQRKLQESVNRYKTVSKATSDTIWDLDLEEDTIRYNSNIYNFFKYEEQQVDNAAEWWRDKLHPDDRQEVTQKLADAINNDTERLQFEYRFKTADGTYKYVYHRAFIIRDKHGKAQRIIGAMQDVTQQKEQKAKLRETNRENRLILESTAEGIYGIDTEGKCTFINKAASDMLGYRAEECIGKNMHKLIHHKYANGKHYPETECPIFVSKNDHESCRVTDDVFWRADGSCFDVEYTSNPMIEDGEIKGAVVAFSDIAERKQHERALNESLKEKETLLMEIHHRVKNNLAVVSGMMQLQAMEEESEEFKNKLLDSVARIHTMASIHELLYKSESFSKLAFDENIKRLVKTLIETMRKEDKKINVKYDLTPVNLNINQAIPCSLIVNEIVTNITKHAFTDQNKGEIFVKVYGEDTLVVEIEDNGKGLPDNFNKNKNGLGLGLQLIETLATQLNAKYDYSTLEKGTKFKLEFEKADLKGTGNALLT